MKTWYHHLVVGLLITIIGILILKDHGRFELAAFGLATAFGSIVPDIDHPSSKIRNSFRIFLVLGSIGIAYLLITTTIVGILVYSYISHPWQIWTASIFIGILIAYLIDRFIPTHRQSVHGVVAAIAYAALCYTIAAVTFWGDPFITGFGGLLGYVSHILTDRL